MSRQSRAKKIVRSREAQRKIHPSQRMATAKEPEPLIARLHYCRVMLSSRDLLTPDEDARLIKRLAKFEATPLDNHVQKTK